MLTRDRYPEALAEGFDNTGCEYGMLNMSYISNFPS